MRRTDQKSLGFRLARSAYHLIPIGASQRESLKTIVYDRFPALFQRLESYRYWQARQQKPHPGPAMSLGPDKTDAAPAVSIPTEPSPESDQLNTRPSVQGVDDEPDFTYETRMANELKTFQDDEEVHDLPQIFHYWSNKHLKRILDDAGIGSIDDFFLDGFCDCARQAGPGRILNFASIGAGNCDYEIRLADSLKKRGVTSFELECLEINPQMLDRGRELARAQGVQDLVRFTAQDFNKWTPSHQYDGIMANQSLHHVVELEHLFDRVRGALRPGASFIVSDMIGRNGHMRWPEALEIVESLWKELPAGYNRNRILRRTEKNYENWDCSTEGFEAIRAQDILALLNKYFEFETFVAFGNVIDIFVDRAFGPNFSVDAQWDRDFIDRVHAIDEAGFQNKTLTPTHLIAVLKTSEPAKRFYSRGLRPEDCIRLPL